ncbi:MAG TPA: hypothetical protein VHM19_20225, partial [Polyangiales bacterium]|nr:hypothetical protein [Polyangiales bacterium]
AAPAAETAAPVEEAPPAATEEAPAPRRGGIPTSVWIAGGATLAFAVAGTITGVLAKSAEKNFNDNRKARFSDQLTQAQQAQAWENANAASNRTYALAITTDVMFAGALVGAGVTIYLYVKSRHAGAESEAQATVEPAIGPHSASLVAHGHF